MRWRVLVVTAMIVTGAGAQVAPFCPTVLRRSADDAFITVRGTGFTSASVVRWSVLNNVVTPLPTRLIDSTELRATVASVLRSNIDISQASLAVVTGSVVQTLGSIQIDHSDGIRLGGFCAIEPKAATAGRRQLAVTIYGYEMRIPLTLVFGPAVGLTSAPRGGGTVTSVTLPAEALQRPGFLNCQVLNPPANLQTPQAPFGIQLNPEPVITGLAAQTVFAGLASSQTLQVSQGTPPYNSWRLRTRDGGAAPAGFSVTPATADSSRAVVTATAPRDVEATTTHQIEAVVNDSSPGGPAEAVSLAPITFETIPKLSIAGLPERNVVAPGDGVDPELTLRIGVTQASSLQITGRVQATFESSASTPGGSQVTTIPADGAFTIAPACVLPSCGVDIRLRAGSVAGSIRLSGTVQASNQAVTPLLTFPAETLSLPPRVPQLFPPRISVRRISGQQFEICVPGITNTRQMNTAQFEFLAAPGKTLGGGPLSRAVSAEFNQWFTVGGVNAGGAFTLAQPFSMTQGDTSYIGSFVVTLVNSVGTSQRVGPIDFSTAPSCNVNF